MTFTSNKETLLLQPTKSHENNVVIVFFFMFTWKGNEMSLSHAYEKLDYPVG